MWGLLTQAGLYLGQVFWTSGGGADGGKLGMAPAPPASLTPSLSGSLNPKS